MATAQSEPRLQRPGFGLPVDYKPEIGDGRFKHAISDYFATTGVTLREISMLDFVNRITDKPRWWEKVHDEGIVGRWRNECGTEEQQRYDPRFLDQKSFDYCIAELRDKAVHYRSHGVVLVLDVMATVVKADAAPSDSFWDAVRHGVEPLENVRDHFKDWHPGSDGQVLDLVHPSLFPVEYGKTRVLPTGIVPKDSCAAYTGMGETCPAFNPHGEDHTPRFGEIQRLGSYGSYQWLPTDVNLDANGHADIKGYINNLHPKQHAHLYPILGQAVEKAVPLWNECLAHYDEALRIRVDNCGFENFACPDDFDENDWPDQNYIGDYPDAVRLIHPTAEKQYVPLAERYTNDAADNELSLDLTKDFPDGLQIIFKLANIHLTPEKPTYAGSNWHVEGALNEHVCATALLYYDQENIQDSYVEFRERIDAEEMIMKPGQDEYIAAERIFGVEQDGSPMQHLGRVLTRSNRILAFPNVLQHRVTPFSLRDPSKSGYRKILAMFLVDPHIRVLSTSNVPPQRRDWWAEEVRKVEPFSALPMEILEHIIEGVEDFPVSWERACEAREALMAERGGINESLEEDWEKVCYRFFIATRDGGCLSLNV